MTKTQRDLMIAVVAVLMCGFAVFRALNLYKKAHPAAAPAAARPAASAPGSSIETQLMEDAQFISSVRSTKQTAEEQAGRWEQDWERDPFRAEEMAASTGIENLVLKGVFWEGDSSKAIINNKMLRVGEAIDGYKVLEIKPKSVVLWTGEKNLELRVFSISRPGTDPVESAPAAPKTAEPAPSPAEEKASDKDPLPSFLPGAKKLNKDLKKVEAFVTNTGSGDELMKMMATGNNPGPQNPAKEESK